MVAFVGFQLLQGSPDLVAHPAADASRACRTCGVRRQASSFKVEATTERYVIHSFLWGVSSEMWINTPDMKYRIEDGEYLECLSSRECECQEKHRGYALKMTIMKHARISKNLMQQKRIMY